MNLTSYSSSPGLISAIGPRGNYPKDPPALSISPSNFFIFSRRAAFYFSTLVHFWHWVSVLILGVTPGLVAGTLLGFLSKDCLLRSNLFSFVAGCCWIRVDEGIEWFVFSWPLRLYISAYNYFIWSIALWRALEFFRSLSANLWVLEVLSSIFLHFSWVSLSYFVSCAFLSA